MSTRYINEFLNYKASHTAVACRSYKTPLKAFCRFVHKPPGKLTINDVTSFQHQQEIKYKPKTVAFQMMAVRGFITYLYDERLTTLNPRRIKIRKVINEPRPYVTPEEFKLIDVCCNPWEFTSLQKKLVIHLLWYTGIRISELCDLNVSNIDHDKSYTQIITKKNKQLRWIMWPDNTHQLLLRYLGVRLTLNQQTPLFIPLQGRKRLTTRTVQRWIVELRKQAGVTKPITAHSFRHGRAHELLRRGATVKEIQLLLGHSEDNPQAAFLYVRLDPAEALRIAKKYISV